MVTVKFTEMNAFLLSSLSENLPVYAQFPLPSGVVFTFADYIKSQLHFPLVAYLPNRSLVDYKLVYDYLFDPSKLKDSGISAPNIFKTLTKVVKYFYSDVAASIQNRVASTEDFEFQIDFSTLDFAPRVQFTEEKIKQTLVQDLSPYTCLNKAKVLEMYSSPNSPLVLINI